MKLPKATAYFKANATLFNTNINLKKIYSPKWLETILNHHSPEEYFQLEEEISRGSGGKIHEFRLLLKEWIDNAITEKDLRIYKKQFEEGQDIKYFRDFFKETMEESSMNSKGHLIELKAYGDSTKIDREVIAFEGRFYNNKLTSFTDKTNSSRYYTYQNSDHKEEVYAYLDMQLLYLFAYNDCVEVLAKATINQILKENINRFLQIIDNINKILDEPYIIKHDELLTHNIYISKSRLRFDHLDTLPVKENDLLLLKDIIDHQISSFQSKYILHPNYTSKIWTPEMIQRIRKVVDGDIHLQVVDQLKAIEKRGKEIIEKIIDEMPEKIRMHLTALKNIIESEKVFYNSEIKDFEIPIRTFSAIQLPIHDSFYEFNTVIIPVKEIVEKTEIIITEKFGYQLEIFMPFIEQVSNSLAQRIKQIFDDGSEKNTKEREYEKQAKQLALEKKAKQLKVNNIAEQLESEKKAKRMEYGKYLLYTLLLAGGIYWFKSRNHTKSDKHEFSAAAINDSSQNQNNNTQSKIIQLKPGKYYISEEFSEGAITYKDVKKKTKSAYRHPSMQLIEIQKNEDSLAYFDSYMNDNYQTIPGGWIEIKYLVPEEGFFMSNYGIPYWVKSDQNKLIVYKDYQKKKNRFTLNAMDKINVYKIKQGMAYFKDFYIGIHKMDGWVEVNRIEKSE